MELTQTYTAPSAVAARGDGLGFALAVEQARPGVRLEALVRHSTSYGRVMRALHRVVSSHSGFEAKDHSAYQEWVQGQYLKELGPALAERANRIPALQKELHEIHGQLAPLDARGRELHEELRAASGGRFDMLCLARGRYKSYLRQYAFAVYWKIYDPVVSVHPDAVLFEVFSRDESSYGCVRVPVENLETTSEIVYGTTNVDYSRALAGEMARVRDYRPAFLSVGGEGVTLQTSAGARVEKKIDLPPSWVRGFLQVQSASALTSTTLRLGAATVGEVLRHLKARREKEGPRSLKFLLDPGEFPVVEIEPWGVQIHEGRFRYEGRNAQEVRIWGRRRLFTLDEMLPFAEAVGVRLMGDGLPSFWSLDLEGHRFELGLSGWTENDWSRAARFDLLASSGQSTPEQLELAAQKLEAAIVLTTLELARETSWSRAEATHALQTLCRQGRVLFDAVRGAYRWRTLFPFAVQSDEEDAKAQSAQHWVEAGQVGVEPVPAAEIEANEFLQRASANAVRLLRAQVQTEGGIFRPLFALDADGRATFFQCTCADFRRDKGRSGPCSHVLAGLQTLLLPELPKITPVSEPAPPDTRLACLFFDHTKMGWRDKPWSEGRIDADASGVYVVVERGEPVSIPYYRTGTPSRMYYHSGSAQLMEDLHELARQDVEIPRIIGFRRSRFRPEWLGEGWHTFHEWIHEQFHKLRPSEAWLQWYVRRHILSSTGRKDDPQRLIELVLPHLSRLDPESPMRRFGTQLQEARGAPSDDRSAQQRVAAIIEIAKRYGVDWQSGLTSPAIAEIETSLRALRDDCLRDYPMLALTQSVSPEVVDTVLDYIRLVDVARRIETKADA